MKIYIYNCNNLNEFLTEVETDTPEKWKGTSTTVKVKKCRIIGKSYAFNPKTNKWDKIIDDWRGITLYNKNNSRITTVGELKAKGKEWSQIEPPDNKNKYIWNKSNDMWQKQVIMIDPKEIIKQYEDAIQKHIDEVAQARGYDNGYTCASYSDDKNTRFASDARIFKDWRSDVWVQVNEMLNNYSSELEDFEQHPSSNLPKFPTIEEVIKLLPLIRWRNI